MQTVQVKSLKKTGRQQTYLATVVSTQLNAWVHQFGCEVDLGAGCNIMPLYIYRLLFRDKKPEPSTVLINGYGDSSVKNPGSCRAMLLTGSHAPQKAVFQVTDIREYLILGHETVHQTGRQDGSRSETLKICSYFMVHYSSMERNTTYPLPKNTY